MSFDSVDVRQPQTPIAAKNRKPHFAHIRSKTSDQGHRYRRRDAMSVRVVTSYLRKARLLEGVNLGAGFVDPIPFSLVVVVQFRLVLSV